MEARLRRRVISPPPRVEGREESGSFVVDEEDCTNSEEQ
jgi:hypothetical protein